ncbi:E3 SUMO-protein ligase PIAS2-like [Amblyomma americanum]
MLPDQPFYLSVNELRLTADMSARWPEFLSCNGKFSTTTAIRSPSRMALVHFDLMSDTPDLSGRTANVSVNGKAYYGMPLTMVNITELLSSSVENRLEFWGEPILADVAVRVDEVKKVTEEELLQWINDSSTYAHNREDTMYLLAAHYAEEDHYPLHDLEVSLLCPLTKTKMRVPGRGVRCHHVQCFDVFAYLDLNETTLQPSWMCPVCGEQVLVQDIRVDLLMLDALMAPDDDCTSMFFPPQYG